MRWPHDPGQADKPQEFEQLGEATQIATEQNTVAMLTYQKASQGRPRDKQSQTGGTHPPARGV
jgi:hypothetical protein